MWATGMWSFAAARAPARVEFVSPGTMTRVGFCFFAIVFLDGSLFLLFAAHGFRFQRLSLLQVW